MLVIVDHRASTVVAPRRFGCVDVTDELDRAVKDSGVVDGVVIAYCEHTTCGLILNGWEDGLLEDLRARLELLVPSDVDYLHDDMTRRTQNLQGGHEPPNGAAHVAQVLLGAGSQAIPIRGGEAVLGRWQRLFLIELDAPRERHLLFQVLGSAERPRLRPIG